MKKAITTLILGLSLAVPVAVLGVLSPSQSASASAPTGAQIVQTALKYVGYPYTWSGDSPSEGFMCTGLVHYAYLQHGIWLSENVSTLYYSYPHVAWNNLRPGDILVFQNTWTYGLSHVGLYIGNNEMVNAESPGRGVRVENMYGTAGYWMRHYVGAVRPYGLASSGGGTSSGSSSHPVVRPKPAPAKPTAYTRTATKASPAPRVATVPLPASGTRHYTVVSGDTLWHLATAFHTSVDSLASWNHLSNINTLQINQVLVVPAQKSSSAPRAARTLKTPSLSVPATTVAILPELLRGDAEDFIGIRGVSFVALRGPAPTAPTAALTDTEGAWADVAEQLEWYAA